MTAVRPMQGAARTVQPSVGYVQTPGGCAVHIGSAQQNTVEDSFAVDSVNSSACYLFRQPARKCQNGAG